MRYVTLESRRYFLASRNFWNRDPLKFSKEFFKNRTLSYHSYYKIVAFDSLKLTRQIVSGLHLAHELPSIADASGGVRAIDP